MLNQRVIKSLMELMKQQRHQSMVVPEFVSWWMWVGHFAVVISF